MKKFCRRIISTMIAICMCISFNVANMAIHATEMVFSIEVSSVAGKRRYYCPEEGVLYIAFNPVNNVVQTPNGTYVNVTRASSEMPAAYIDYYNELHDDISLNDVRFISATNDFNCHSYAWYSQNTETNIYWMNDPSVYYSSHDGSYVVITTPNPGDIICYFNADGDNLHSGIVVGSSGEASNGLCGNSNAYIVESKWGDGGVFRHNGYECLYTSYVGEDATYVVYYRPNFYLNGVLHTQHTFTTHNDFGNPDYHKSVCACGQTIHGVHDWYESQVGARGLDYVPTYICSGCGATALRQDIYP